jgi:hypothetical protein
MECSTRQLRGGPARWVEEGRFREKYAVVDLMTLWIEDAGSYIVKTGRRKTARNNGSKALWSERKSKEGRQRPKTDCLGMSARCWAMIDD